jgi:hypothetical protein
MIIVTLAPLPASLGTSGLPMCKGYRNLEGVNRTFPSPRFTTVRSGSFSYDNRTRHSFPIGGGAAWSSAEHGVNSIIMDLVMTPPPTPPPQPRLPQPRRVIPRSHPRGMSGHTVTVGVEGDSASTITNNNAINKLKILEISCERKCVMRSKSAF